MNLKVESLPHRFATYDSGNGPTLPADGVPPPNPEALLLRSAVSSSLGQPAPAHSTHSRLLLRLQEVHAPRPAGRDRNGKSRARWETLGLSGGGGGGS